MSLLNKIKDFLRKNPDKAQSGIDKAASTVDQRTGGKRTGQIDKAADQARKYVGGEGSQGGQGQP